MAYSEEWSEQANEDLSQITGYLLEKWSEKTALDFIEKLHKTIGLILQNPNMGKRSEKKPNLRKFVFNRQTSIIYEIKPNAIRIIALLDNRKKI